MKLKPIDIHIPLDDYSNQKLKIINRVGIRIYTTVHLITFNLPFQMRFQQKQQQEREQKKTDIAGTRSLTNLDAGDTKNSLSSSLGPGKVRQMFDERRHRVVGIDKSYPLKPIPTKPTAPNATNDNNNNNLNSTTISSKRVPPQTKSGVGNVVGSINRQTTGSSIATTAVTSTINSKPRVPPMMNRRKIETEVSTCKLYSGEFGSCWEYLFAETGQ